MALPNVSLDFPGLMAGTNPIRAQFAHINASDLPGLTSALYDDLSAVVARSSSVVFIASDPSAENEIGWNIAHVVVHLTAGLEENASQASTLARGAAITGRPRYETDWESVTSREQVEQRIAESRRMVEAFLRTWPDQPHVDETHTHQFFGEINAVHYHTLGLAHARGHLAQIDEIARQAAQ